MALCCVVLLRGNLSRLIQTRHRDQWLKSWHCLASRVRDKKYFPPPLEMTNCRRHSEAFTFFAAKTKKTRILGIFVTSGTRWGFLFRWPSVFNWKKEREGKIKIPRERSLEMISRYLIWLFHLLFSRRIQKVRNWGAWAWAGVGWSGLGLAGVWWGKWKQTFRTELSLKRSTEAKIWSSFLKKKQKNV